MKKPSDHFRKFDSQVHETLFNQVDFLLTKHTNGIYRNSIFWLLFSVDTSKRYTHNSSPETDYRGNGF